MNDKHKTKWEQRLDTIIFDEDVTPDDAEKALEGLDDEDQEGVEEAPTQELAVYEHQESRVQKTEDEDTDLVDDYHYSRDTLYGLLERGKTALEGSLMVARESEHPRAYEVTSAIMKNISDITKQLMDVSESMAKQKAGTGDGDKGKKGGDTYNTQINHNYGDQSVDDVLNGLDDEKNE